jgi:hypothetical protein
MKGSGFLPSFWSWGQTNHPKIFISYRRHGEGAGYGGRIADKLVERFGAEQCFRDVANIESGVDFVNAIEEAVSSCEILIAVIGPDWISQKYEFGGRRLDDPRDFVRLEVAAALDRNIRVIPVLVGGSSMPKDVELPESLQGLARRQAQELSDSRWEYDMDRLLHTIESIGIRPHSQNKQSSRSRTLKTVGAATGGAVLLTSIIVGSMSNLTGAHALPSEAPTRVEEPTVPSTNSYTPPVESKPSPIAVVPAVQTSVPTSQNTVDGLYGTLRVGWQHEGTLYDSVVAINGARGVAAVTFFAPEVGSQISVEQDIALVRNAAGAFYVGSSPRIAGTATPALFYAPDIFKLAQLPNGTWTISDVGDKWDHLDKAISQVVQ